MKNKSDCPKRVKILSPRRKPNVKRVFSEEDLQLTRIPKNFEIELLEKVVTDLLDSADINADPEFEQWYRLVSDDISSAIRSRVPERVIALGKALAPQRILAMGVKRADIFYTLYQIGALLKKFPFPSSTGKQKALNDFHLQEQSNRLFNEVNHRAIVSLSLRHPDWRNCIEEIRADIRGLMGEQPRQELVFRLAQHGPGTSVGFEGSEGKDTTFFKWLTLPYTVSPAARPYAIAAIESNPLWVRALHDWFREKNKLTIYEPIDMEAFWASVLKIVDYCRYTSVPKTFDTERGIAIEPTLNVFLQLGCKAILYARLKKRWAIDLTDQSCNQKRAISASIKDDEVTVDLKGASNSVSVLAAALLLPVGWFDFLDDLRSRNILIPLELEGKKHVLRTEMFSAMGNGFTFAIETIIFAAIARYAMRKVNCTGSPAVYGDDIIVPAAAYPVLRELLILFGFTINDDKSFVSGPFRESCGADCFSGQLITPVKISEPVKNVKDLWKLHNSFVLKEVYLPWFFHVRFTKTKDWLKGFIPSNFRKFSGLPSESVDNYLFTATRPRCQPDRTYNWQGITTRPVEFNSRSDAFFFRSLMVDHHPRPEWRVLDPVKNGGSAYDITIRGHVVHKITSFTGYL